MEASNNHYPDNWVVLKVADSEKGPHYRVLVDWEKTGAWRLSAVVSRVTDTETQFIFHSKEGTFYCRKEEYGLGIASQIIYPTIQEYTEIMSEKTHWKALPVSFYCQHCEQLMYRCGICYTSVCSGVATAGCRGCAAAYQEYVLYHYGVDMQDAIH